MTQAELYAQLRELLIAARQAQGLTQVEIADRLGKPQSFVSKYESGERRLDVIELIEICRTLDVSPAALVTKLSGATESILSRWEISEAELSELVQQNPSLRGIMLGYVAEKKFHDSFLRHPDITEARKDDDHDRRRKGDRRIIYQGQAFIVEVKSLQTNLVKHLDGDTWIGKTQVDASDNREISFPDGSKLKTTCLRRSEFDLLAVNCFAFGEQWRFAFALNAELPANTYKKYTAYQRQHILPTLITVTWPPQPPFTDNPFPLLDKLIRQKSA